MSPAPTSSDSVAPLPVSIIVCTYNRCESLVDTLESFRTLEIPPGIACEILVIDNNSRDRTAEVVRRFAETAPLPTRYVFEPKQGLSNARNRGIEESGGDIILFTDDDVVVDRAWLRWTVAALTSSNAACAGGKVLPLWKARRPEWLSDRLLNVLAMLDYGDQQIELGRDGDPRILYGANLAFRRAPLLAAGAFNTQLGRNGAFGAGEDKEIQEKLHQMGHAVMYEPRSVVLHKVDPQRLSKEYFRLWHYNAGRDRARTRKPSKFTVFGIESSLFVQFARTVLAWLRAAVLWRRERLFELELHCILYLSVFKHKLAQSFARQPAQDVDRSVGGAT